MMSEVEVETLQIGKQLQSMWPMLGRVDIDVRIPYSRKCMADADDNVGSGLEGDLQSPVPRSLMRQDS